MSSTSYEAVIVGAGPIGLECSVNFLLNDISHLLIDAGALGNTILNWSHHTHFLSTPERLEICQFPLHNVNQLSPDGQQYLGYLRSVAEFYDVPLCTFHKLEAIERTGAEFRLTISNRAKQFEIVAKNVVLATGAMNYPRKLGVPGESLDFVHHHYRDFHQYFRKKLLIVGDGNSALEAVFRGFRVGAEIVVSMLIPSVNPDEVRLEYYREFQLLEKKNLIRVYYNSEVSQIAPGGHCRLVQDGQSIEVQADFVLSCIGYQYDTSIFEKFGIEIKEGKIPQHDPNTMETNVKGLYLAGTVAGGEKYSKELFIGTCHQHVENILKVLKKEPIFKTGSPPSRHFQFSYDEVNLKARDLLEAAED